MENQSYLVHSAKGTTWSKKQHKYIKKIDGKYYYGTQAQLSAVKHLNDEAGKLEVEAGKEKRLYNINSKKSDYWEKEYNKTKNRVVPEGQEGTGIKGAYNKNNRNKMLEAQANEVSYIERYKANEKRVQTLLSKSEKLRSAANKVTVKAQVKALVDKILRRK